MENTNLCQHDRDTTPIPQAKSIDSLVTDFAPFVGQSKEEKVMHEYDIRSYWLQGELANKLEVPASETTKGIIELQLERIDSRLDNMIKFGNELINNVKIHAEKQEMVQRRSKQAKFDELQLAVQEESADAMRQYEEISAKWPKIMNMNEPMVIYNKLEDQKEAIEKLLAGKDKVIEQCQQQFNRVTEKYYVNIQKQSNDMCFLIDRVDQQINEIKRAYNESFKELETTIEDERQRLGEEWRNNWNDMFEKLKDGEEKKLSVAKEKQKFYAEELRKICVKQEEVTRATKITMEKDAEQLEVELRKTRYNIIMNSEKIDYNYQVLQKRNEENVILNNQQKRRVAKLKESIALMKDKLRGLRRSNRVTIERLVQDIQKLHDSVNELQVKVEQNQQDNIRKFNSVWRMNFNELKDLLYSIGRIEHILHEQQLMLPWTGTYHHMDELDIAKPTPCIQKPDETSSKASKDEQLEEIEEQKRQKVLRSKQFRDVLWNISDRAGFLVESKLSRILEPYSEKDKCIVRIENIFTALHINDIETVDLLIKFFENYSYCPNCVNLPPEDQEDKAKEPEEEDVAIIKPFTTEKQEPYSTLTPYADRKTVKMHSKCPNHYLVVEPTLVLTALNDFTMTKNRKVGKVKTSKCNSGSEKETLNLLAMDVSEIKAFWENVSSSHNMDDKMRLWDMLEHGLNHYLEVLKEREQLHRECKSLETQNAELQYFLKNILANDAKQKSQNTFSEKPRNSNKAKGKPTRASQKK